MASALVNQSSRSGASRKIGANFSRKSDHHLSPLCQYFSTTTQIAVVRSTTDIVISYGDTSPDDEHLLARIVAIDGDIRARDRTARTAAKQIQNCFGFERRRIACRSSVTPTMP